MGERILVVDDEEINRELLEAMLASEGYTVTLAEDGPTALRTVDQARPDLILLDLLMPGMDGLEVCRNIRSAAPDPRVPIIVITAVGQMTAKEGLLTNGADDFVTKPFEPEDLRLRVRTLLKVRGIARDLDRTLAYLGELDRARSRVRPTEPAASGATPGVTGPDTGGPPAVLLVDDDEISREFYGDLLEEYGYVVHAASTGRDGLALAGAQPIEAALVDIVMPGMSGLELLECLGKRDRAMPVIILTSHPTSQHAIAALKLGALDFIVKGQDHMLVVLAVHRAIRHRREVARRESELTRLRARICELEAQVAAQKGRA